MRRDARQSKTWMLKGKRKKESCKVWRNGQMKLITEELRMRRKQQQFKESAGKEAAVLKC